MTATALNRFRRGAGLIIALTWLTSLLLPALSMKLDGVNVRTLRGYDALTSGWFGLAWLQPAWLANVTIVGNALALSTSVFSRRFLLWSGLASPLLASGSADLLLRPSFNGFVGYHLGFFLWLLASILAAGSSIIVVARSIGPAVAR